MKNSYSFKSRDKCSLSFLFVYFLISILLINNSMIKSIESTLLVKSKETTSSKETELLKASSEYKHKSHNKKTTNSVKSQEKSENKINNFNSFNAENFNDGVNNNNSKNKSLFYPTSTMVKFKRIPVNSRFVYNLDKNGKSEIIDPRLRLGNSVSAYANANGFYESNKFPISPKIKGRMNDDNSSSTQANANGNTVQSNNPIDNKSSDGNNSNTNANNVNTSNINNKTSSGTGDSGASANNSNSVIYKNKTISENPTIYYPLNKFNSPNLNNFNTNNHQLPQNSLIQAPCGCAEKFPCPNCSNPIVVFKIKTYFNTCPCAKSTCKPCISNTKLHQLSLLKAMKDQKAIKFLKNNTEETRNELNNVSKQLDFVIKFERQALKAAKELEETKFKAYIAKTKMFANSEKAKLIAKATLNDDIMTKPNIPNTLDFNGPLDMLNNNGLNSENDIMDSSKEALNFQPSHDFLANNQSIDPTDLLENLTAAQQNRINPKLKYRKASNNSSEFDSLLGSSNNRGNFNGNGSGRLNAFDDNFASLYGYGLSNTKGSLLADIDLFNKAFSNEGNNHQSPMQIDPYLLNESPNRAMRNPDELFTPEEVPTLKPYENSFNQGETKSFSFNYESDKNVNFDEDLNESIDNNSIYERSNNSINSPIESAVMNNQEMYSINSDSREKENKSNLQNRRNKIFKENNEAKKNKKTRSKNKNEENEEYPEKNYLEDAGNSERDSDNDIASKNNRENKNEVENSKTREYDYTDENNTFRTPKNAVKTKSKSLKRKTKKH